ncbi:tryptophan synthase subunit alpha [Heyndrickxia acidicola]|uniref:Tryptophan synthase alpha chain n=1 Tax=Heyndrickxia acidicola TaxID=209389 RepID=A0ABU6MJX0_9BACI|nr:tryptophan synthase subunit alpha [Heyndrickxia acidicola]MED1204986.1 tryptophan synthase subunit alpha [Heyndrickxia acidicola]
MGKNRIDRAFQAVLDRDEKAFVPYIMAGDGGLEILGERLTFLEESGATVVEVGVPFSDPVADGPTIQAAGIRALEAGTTLKGILAELTASKSTRSIPIVMMSYFNPIYVYGAEIFAQECVEAGVDGLIIPDLPYEEEEIIADELDKYGISLIRLAAITSPDERLEKLAKQTEGFLYAVTVTGITGARTSIREGIALYLKKLKQYSKVPVLAGFGVSTPEQVRELGDASDGVVVGSRIIELFQKNDLEAIQALIQASKGLEVK